MPAVIGAGPRGHWPFPMIEVDQHGPERTIHAALDPKRNWYLLLIVVYSSAAKATAALCRSCCLPFHPYCQQYRQPTMKEAPLKTMASLAK